MPTAEIDYETLRIPWQVDHSWKLIWSNGSGCIGPGRSVEEACARLQVDIEFLDDYEDLGPATNNMVALTTWERWFAWHPVTLDHGNGKRVWLRMIQRGRFICGHDAAVVWFYKL